MGGAHSFANWKAGERPSKQDVANSNNRDTRAELSQHREHRGNMDATRLAWVGRAGSKSMHFIVTLLHIHEQTKDTSTPFNWRGPKMCVSPGRNSTF